MLDSRDVSVFASALVQSNVAVAEDGHAPGLVGQLRRTAGERPSEGTAMLDSRDVSVFANALVQSNDAVAEDGHAPGLVGQLRPSPDCNLFRATSDTQNTAAA
jgi:hypothetical protein